MDIITHISIPTINSLKKKICDSESHYDAYYVADSDTDDELSNTESILFNSKIHTTANGSETS